MWQSTSNVLMLAAGLALVPTGCRPPGDVSSLKHRFGEVRADGTRTLCQQSAQPDFPLAHAYLRSLMRAIASANPDTFRDDLAVENICLTVVDNAALNAFAKSEKNEISFNTGLILKASVDSELASVLAHEMAHLAMMTGHRPIPDYLVTDPGWPAFRVDYDAKLASLKSVEGALLREMREVKGLRAAFRKNFMDRASTGPLQKMKEEMAALAVNYWKLAGDSKRLNRDDARRFENLAITIPELDYFSEEESRTMKSLRRISDMTRPVESDPRHIAAIEQNIRAMSAISERIRGEMLKVDAEAVYAFRHLVVRSAELSARYEVVAASLKALHSSYERFIRSITEPGTFENWTEQEADEVGYEYFLRAGFRAEDYVFLEKAGMGLEDFNRCMAENVRTGIAPKRGQSTHPSRCWRVFDMLYLESRAHAQDYAPLFKTALRANLVEGALEQVKASLPPPAPDRKATSGN